MVRTILLALLVLGTLASPSAGAVGSGAAQGNGHCIVIAPGDIPPVHVDPEDCIPRFAARGPPPEPPAVGRE